MKEIEKRLKGMEEKLNQRLDDIESVLSEIYEALHPTRIISLQEIFDKYGSDVQGAHKAIKQRQRLIDYEQNARKSIKT